MVQLPYHYGKVRILDIDGTVLKLRVLGDYFEKEAEAYTDSVEIVNEWFKNGDFIIFWTARPECYRELTTHQLDNLGFLYHRLMMDKPTADGGIYWYDDADIRAFKVDNTTGLVSMGELVDY